MVTDYHLASYLRSMLPKCLHHLGKQVMSLFQHRVRQALDLFFELEPSREKLGSKVSLTDGRKLSISGCLCRTHHGSILIVYLIKGLTYF